ncbi:hypothetical protein KM043_010812 [Ampulex compressa]|nr:hypothetical protein KM043_010812 [Ampulex compressa]
MGDECAAGEESARRVEEGCGGAGGGRRGAMLGAGVRGGGGTDGRRGEAQRISTSQATNSPRKAESREDVDAGVRGIARQKALSLLSRVPAQVAVRRALVPLPPSAGAAASSGGDRRRALPIVFGGGGARGGSLVADRRPSRRQRGGPRVAREESEEREERKVTGGGGQEWRHRRVRVVRGCTALRGHGAREGDPPPLVTAAKRQDFPHRVHREMGADPCPQTEAGPTPPPEWCGGTRRHEVRALNHPRVVPIFRSVQSREVHFCMRTYLPTGTTGYPRPAGEPGTADTVLLPRSRVVDSR